MFTHMRVPVLHALDLLVQQKILPPDYPQDAVLLETPREAAHGDIALNAALVLAKPAQCPPRQLAEKIVKALETIQPPEIKQIAIAGPGFINLTLHEDFFRNEIPAILAAGASYGAPDLGKGKPINVEYVSANPTGPLHIGHARGAVFGDVLANLLAHAGYQVCREFYVNDAGAQMEKLVESLSLRIRETKGETITIPDDGYPGEYLIPVAKELTDTPPQSLRHEAREAMMNLIRDDLASLNITHDHFTYESDLLAQGKIEKAIAGLTKKNLVYDGVPPAPKGAAEHWQPRRQPLFRASQFGDEQDRPLQRATSGWTYFAGDIACHADKYQRGFEVMINVWGADHAGYVPRLQAAVNALSGGKAELDVRLCHLIRLMKDGKPVKMSKRAGTLVELKELVEEAGADAVRFLLLTRRQDAPLDFDMARAREQSKDNPVFYVNYAHARICSVLRQCPPDILAQSEKGEPAPLDLLTHPAELAIMRHLALWPSMLERATLAREPHRVAYYLQELASRFHSLWTSGRDDPSLRFLIPSQRNATLARLQLIRSCQVILATGLDLLGIVAAETM